MRPLVIVGAGGFARETAEAVHAVNDARPTWELLGFVDDAEHLHGTAIDGVRVIGGIDMVADLPDAQVVVCTGNPRNYGSRRVLVTRLGLTPDRYASVVHPTATLARSTSLGAGSVVLATTVTTASVRVGAHVAVMPGVILPHDVVVDDYATLGSGVRVGGGVVVSAGAYVGAGALVREDVVIGAGSLVGMGAVVLTDVPPAEVWVGVPARRLASAPVPVAAAR